MGIGETIVLVCAVGFVLAVCIKKIVDKKRGKIGCSDCSSCPHGACCAVKKKVREHEKE